MLKKKQVQAKGNISGRDSNTIHPMKRWKNVPADFKTFEKILSPLIEHHQKGLILPNNPKKASNVSRSWGIKHTHQPVELITSETARWKWRKAIQYLNLHNDKNLLGECSNWLGTRKWSACRRKHLLLHSLGERRFLDRFSTAARNSRFPRHDFTMKKNSQMYGWGSQTVFSDLWC